MSAQPFLRSPLRLWGILACALLLGALAALPASAATVEERYEKTVSLPAGGQVAIQNTNGKIEVRGWDRDEVRVVAIKKAKAASRSEADKALDRLQIELDRGGDALAISTTGEKQGWSFWRMLSGNNVSVSVSYEITMPRRADLAAQTTNGGVAVADLEGRVSARSTNGGLKLTDLAGSVDASTTNGGIQVQLASWDGRGMDLSTTNGGVSLTLPEDARADLVASTVNGKVRVEGLDLREEHRSRRKLTGTLNGGGSPIEISTVNGGVKVSGR